MSRPAPVRAVELRVLDGPNLYFPRPAIKLTLAMPGLDAASDARVRAVAERLGVPGADVPGRAGTEQRRRVDDACGCGVRTTRRHGVGRATPRRAGAARPRARPHRRGVPVAPARGGAHARDGDRARDGRHAAGPLAAALADRGRAPASPARIRVPSRRCPIRGSPSSRSPARTGRPPRCGSWRTSCAVRAFASPTPPPTASTATTGTWFGRGDYSGFGGAAMALAQDPDVAVLETARGGMLLRGLRRAAQRRGGRDERERRPPRPARRRHGGSARRGQGASSRGSRDPTAGTC